MQWIVLAENHQSLRYAPNQQSSNTLLLAPYRYFGCYAALRRKGHLHQSCDFASTESLAIKFEGVRAVRESDVGTIERLEREGLSELFCGICERRSQFLNDGRGLESNAHLLCS